MKSLCACSAVFCGLLLLGFSHGAGHQAVRVATESHSASDDDNSFVATNEWQEIKPGQTIPRGLHVRIDMTTGKKEAKLMDPVQKTREKEPVTGLTAVAHSEQPENESSQDRRGFTHEELAKAMSKMKAQEGEDEISRALREAEIRKKFRSYEQLKKELDSVKMKLQTDYEVLDGLVSEYETLKDLDTADGAAKLASVLEELEFHVHRYDTARDFADDAGFTRIVLPALNSSYVDVRAAAAFLTGSALQSNPKVQISALEAGLVESLLRVVKLDESGLVRKRALYALSGLVRQFPVAQKRLIAAGGLDVFASIFKLDTDEDRQMQLKIITLLQDLVLEHADAVKHMNITNDLHREKLRQYESVNLASAAKKHGFCHYIPMLLFWPEKDTRDRRQDLSSAINEAIPVRPEHDVVEKVLDAMRAFGRTCKDEFRTSSLATLQMLRDSYVELANRESASSHADPQRRHVRQPGDPGDDAATEAPSEMYPYYSHLAATAASVCEMLSANSSELKDEL